MQDLFLMFLMAAPFQLAGNILDVRSIYIYIPQKFTQTDLVSFENVGMFIIYDVELEQNGLSVLWSSSCMARCSRDTTCDLHCSEQLKLNGSSS